MRPKPVAEGNNVRRIPNLKIREQITALLTSLAGVWIMYYAWIILKLGSIHVPDAGFLPFLCGAGLTILGFAWLLVLQWAKRNEAPAEQRLWHRPLISLLLMGAYGWAMESLGYITSTLIFVIAWQQIIEQEKWVKTTIVAVLSTLAMYALFVHLLKVPVPSEFFLR